METYGLDLSELIVELETEGFGDDAEINSTITLLVETATASEARGLSTETAVQKFVAENPTATNMQLVLTELAGEFFKNGNKDDYFSSYTNLLFRSSEFGLAPAETPSLLQKFYIRLKSTEVPGFITTFGNPLLLSPQDNRILEYVGGAIIRRLFFHRNTSPQQKKAIEALAGEVKRGSIAFEREREKPESCQPTTTRLWGISETLKQVVQEAEIHFRSHIQQHPQLNINSTYFNEFLQKASVDDIIRKMAEKMSWSTVTAIIEKILVKFTKCRAHTYSRKLEKCFKQKAPTPASAKGLRT